MSKFLENLDFSQNFAKSRFRSKFCKNSILVKILENLECGQNSRKISILVKILENLDFGQIIRNLNFGKKTFLDNLDFFFIIFGKTRGWSRVSENLDFDQNFAKIFSLFFSNFLKS